MEEVRQSFGSCSFEHVPRHILDRADMDLLQLIWSQCTSVQESNNTLPAFYMGYLRYVKHSQFEIC